MPYGTAGIFGEMSKAVPAGLDRADRDLLPCRSPSSASLGLYGKLFDSTVGMIGFALVMFWVFTALSCRRVRHDPDPRLPDARSLA